MGYGNMIFATNNIFNKEVLGDCGIFYNKDPKELSKKLSKILSNRNMRIQFQKKAVERIKANYTWGKISEQYLDLFIKCVSKTK